MYCNDFPDPFVLRVGDTYYLYSTNTAGYHVPVLTTSGITGSGSRHDALPTLPAWSAGDEVWAPSVLQRGSAFVLYYATRPSGSNGLCISAAIAAQPAGPFVDRSSGPMICPSTGAIDPSPFVDANGQAYLLWKNDGPAASISSQPLDPTGLRLVGAPSTLLTANQAWENHVVEAPSMVRDGSSYYLFYSGGQWNTANYAIGYAVCTSPSGPCTKALDHPWLGSNFTAQGPGARSSSPIPPASSGWSYTPGSTGTSAIPSVRGTSSCCGSCSWAVSPKPRSPPERWHRIEPASPTSGSRWRAPRSAR